MIVLPDAAATEALGARLARLVRAGDIIALGGGLGAGKTTLARGLLRGLGWPGEAPSPSFTLVERYEAPPLRLPAWHADLYRLGRPEEALALGLDEAEAGLLLVEWPERLGLARLPDALRLTLSAYPGGGRALTADVPEAWAGRWPPPP
ncbi:MAG: tRNA (adenosine(37)-N6)-threonylcarbamoyltransferase complex ATPase subunit type 1 TsaE [Sphingomonadaceae bacterium]